MGNYTGSDFNRRITYNQNISKYGDLPEYFDLVICTSSQTVDEFGSFEYDFNVMDRDRELAKTVVSFYTDSAHCNVELQTKKLRSHLEKVKYNFMNV